MSRIVPEDDEEDLTYQARGKSTVMAVIAVVSQANRSAPANAGADADPDDAMEAV